MNKELRKVYKNVFNTADGKKVLRDLMKVTGLYETTHTYIDPNQAIYNEGQRRTLLYILAFMKSDEFFKVYDDINNTIKHNNEDTYE